jgi:FlaA1/EpsC-like NDP-sugar epimerase
MIFVCASRWSFRLLRALIVGPTAMSLNAKPTLIYGAGDQGEWLVKELLERPIAYRYRPVGYLDDDSHKVGKLLHGLTIYGSHELAAVVRRYQICTVLVASEKIPDSKLAELETLELEIARAHMSLEIRPCSTEKATLPGFLKPVQEDHLNVTAAPIS